MNINIEYLKEKKELVSVVLLGGSALLVVLMLYYITSFFTLSTKTENIILNTVKRNETSKDKVTQILQSAQNMADALIQNNPFSPPPQQETQQVAADNPITEVKAILGNTAWINNQWYAVGDSIQGARITAIDGNYVTVDFNGQLSQFSPYNATIVATDATQYNGNLNNNLSNLINQLTGGRGGMMGGGMMGGMMGGGRNTGRGGRGGGGFGGGGFGGGGFGGGGFGGGGRGGGGRGGGRGGGGRGGFGG